MSKLSLSVVILVLHFVLISANVKAQDMWVSCSRSTIESYSGNEKKPVLLYLDEARSVADKFVRSFAEDKFDEIYQLNKNLKIWIERNPNEHMFQASLTEVKEKYGRITSYEYRNQSLFYSVGYPISLRYKVSTWYSVKTAKSESDNLYMSVETYKNRVEDSAYPLGARLREQKKNKSPWEYFNSPEKKCSGMNDKLLVYLPK